MEGKLKEYNESHTMMELELFDQAIEHVCRIARIVEMPRGHALLVGVGGSGKQSLTKLAAFLCGYEVFQIAVTSNYGLTEFRADLQELYRRVGLKGQKLVFLMNDGQIVEEDMLMYINDLLSSGDIPDLFAEDEKDNISSAVANEVKQTGQDYGSRAICYEFFLEKARRSMWRRCSNHNVVLILWVSSSLH